MHDVCIVGSGFAGLFLAERLAARGLDTLLLEAGSNETPSEVAEGRDPTFPYVASGEGTFPLDFNRAIALGGTSRLWNGVVSRFLPSDFRTRSGFRLFTDWPIGYEDLRRYYDEAERLLSTAGGVFRPGAEPPRDTPYPVVWPEEKDAFRARPVSDELAFFPLAFSTRRPTARAGHAIRLHEVEVSRFSALPSATLRASAPALRLVSKDGEAITAVETLRKDGVVERLAARTFVLAAGVLETARLLLLSGSKAWPRGLGNRHDQLGRFVHAHPRHRTWVRRHGPFREMCTAYRSYAYCDSLRSEGLGSVCLDVNLLGADAAIDLTQETEPAFENRIRLDPSQIDRWGRPIALLSVNPTPLDRRTEERVERLDTELRPRLLATHETLGQSSVTWFHPAGSCRMASGPEDGVVDRDGRVFGLANLYVTGAATFPTSGATNPTLTVVALALRLADHLFARFGLSRESEET